MNKVYKKVLKFESDFPGGLTWRVKKHCKVIESYLDSDEKVFFAFSAQKNEKFYEIINTFVIVLTNKRLILARKRVLWGSFFYSITPDLYNDMEIYKGLIWGRITIDTVKEKVVLSNLPKKGLDEIETNISNFMLKEKKKYKNIGD